MSREFGSALPFAVGGNGSVNGESTIRPYVRDRVALEKNLGFKALSEEIQKQVRKQMNSYQMDRVARRNLYVLVTDSNFAMLSHAGQIEALRGLSAARQSEVNLKGLLLEVKDRATLERDPDFQKLPEATQKEVIERMESAFFDPRQRERLITIATDREFAKLSTAKQHAILKTLDSNPPMRRILIFQP